MKLKPITPPDVEALKLRAVGILLRAMLDERESLKVLVSLSNESCTVEDFALQQQHLDTIHALTLAFRIVKGEVTLEGKEIPQAPAIPTAIHPKFELERDIERIVKESSNAVGEDEVRVQRAGQPR